MTTAYDAAGYPVSASDGTKYTTDPTGALLKVRKGTSQTTYRYHAFGRQVEATVGVAQVSYEYDALDRTISRTRGATTTCPGSRFLDTRIGCW